MNAGRPAVLEGGASAAPARASTAFASLGALLRSSWEVLPLAGFALALALVYLAAAPIAGLPFDDSYISLLFARNLAEHGFLTFDGESASAGATSLLHVAILAVPIKLGADPVKASLGLGIALHVGLVVAVYWLARTIFRDRLTAALAGGSAGIMGYLTLDALNGMETTLFLLTCTAASAAYLAARSDRGYLLAGLIAALALLTRPEGALLLLAMVAYEVVRPDRQGALLAPGSLRRLALLAVPGAAALLALAFFHQTTTGSFTPGTATAKFLFFREFELSLQGKFNLLDEGLGNFLAPLLPWLALSAFAVRRREALLFAFFWLAFIVMYFFLFPGGITHYWYRYQHVFLPALAVFGAGGAVALVRGRRWRAADAAALGAVGIVVLAAVAFQYNGFRLHYVADVRVNETRQAGIARYLDALLPPDATVATHDIGAIGYFSHREVIDLVGLVNQDVIEYHDGRRLREYVDRVQPDYIVVFLSWEEQFLHLGLREDRQLFEEIERFPGDGREPFVLYRTHYPANPPASDS